MKAMNRPYGLSYEVFSIKKSARKKLTHDNGGPHHGVVGSIGQPS